jgi:hypothetical protein
VPQLQLQLKMQAPLQALLLLLLLLLLLRCRRRRRRRGQRLQPCFSLQFSAHWPWTCSRCTLRAAWSTAATFRTCTAWSLQLPRGMRQ